MSPIKVSVIIPVFNAAPYLDECLSSVTNQTLKEIEVICVDDGSTDTSLSQLKKWQEKDARIHVFSQENAGAGVARNKGIEKARGEFVCFMDADDFYFNDAVLNDLYQAAISHQVNICGGELQKLEEKNQTQYQFQETALIQASDYPVDYGFTRFLYNRQFLLENRIVFPALIYHEDLVFFVKALKAAKVFLALARPVYCYRTGHKSKKPLTSAQMLHFVEGISMLLALSKENDALYHRVVQRLQSSFFQRNLAHVLKDDSVQDILKSKIKAIFDDLDWNKIFTYTPDFRIARLYHDMAVITPKVTIITPIYNVARYLDRCLTSLAAQTYTNIEVLCVNNMSTDNSQEIIDAWCQRDKRFKPLVQICKALVIHAIKALRRQQAIIYILLILMIGLMLRQSKNASLI